MPKKKGKKGKGAGDDPSLRPQILRDKLKKEDAYTVGNAVKLKDTHRLGIRANRCDQLKEDIAALRRTFERRDQDLNRAVERFACGVQEGERLSAQVWRVHREHVERLRAMQEKRLDFLQQQWDTGQDALGHRLELLSERMATYFLQSRESFEDTVVHLERHHQQALAIIHMLYSEPMEAHSVYEKRKAFEVEECFLDQNVQVLKNQKAEERYLHEMENVERMEAKKQVSVTTSKKGVALYNTIIEVQSRLEATEKSNSTMTAKLTAARNDAKAKIHMLLSQMARDRVPVQIMINEVSMHSNAAASTLRLIIAKGARLLKVAEMCRHLEAQQKEEQVDPQEVAEEFATRLVAPSHMFEFPELMKRYNAAQVHQDALKRRNKDLRRENQQLHLLTRQRVEAKTLKPDTHNGPYNPLLVKMAPIMEKDAIRQVRCVVEGVHAIRILSINE
ncbi:dynein regulatory complex subunit 2-like [Syngnathoides biaculeatus]|uniref:dynein regulatory complex subunit 2-like n=1 Tax=Syngnathoides biaculeatus TaxID=300417 RepID=UPI002ADE79AF|nr:dynein regulatory complex subunit 2-like [Syngnathoides biaculeatus]